MRKICMFNLITLDGCFEGPKGDIDWHRVDEEFHEFAGDQLREADGLIFGRKTYQMMASYWPTPEAIADDPVISGYMNALPKIVFSRTLDRAEWNNTRLIQGDAEDEVARLRQEPGRDLFIFGSADLSASLTRHGLIDEYRLMIVPLILGNGRPLFSDGNPVNLSLLRQRTFHNGNVLLVYQPARS